MNNFVFHGEWVTAISRLPNDVRLELYDAIVRYAITGEEPTLKPMARVAFDFVQPTLDIDRDKYEAMCVRNRENRTKGCRELLPMVTSGDERSQVGSNNNNSNNSKEEPPKGGKKKDALSSSTRKPLELLEKRKRLFHDSLVPFIEKYGKDMIRAFYDYWTEPNKSKSKMRYELEKTWDTSRRLVTWAARDSSSFRNGTTQNTKPDIEAIQQREDENAERNRRYEEMRRNAVSREEAMKDPEYLRALQES